MSRFGTSRHFAAMQQFSRFRSEADTVPPKLLTTADEVIE
jgi:hypothetical protein